MFRLKAESVAQKIWTVGAKHKAEHQEDPFSNNQLLRDAIADVVALDDPIKPKIPVSNETLQALRQRLDLTERKSFVLWSMWTAIKFAITYSVCSGCSGWHAYGTVETPDILHIK